MRAITVEPPCRSGGVNVDAGHFRVVRRPRGLQVVQQTVQDACKLPFLVHASSRDAVAVNDEPTTVRDIERRSGTRRTCPLVLAVSDRAGRLGARSRCFGVALVEVLDVAETPVLLQGALDRAGHARFRSALRLTNHPPSSPLGKCVRLVQPLAGGLLGVVVTGLRDRGARLRKRLARIVRFSLQPRIALPTDGFVEAAEDEPPLPVEAAARLPRGFSPP